MTMVIDRGGLRTNIGYLFEAPVQIREPKKYQAPRSNTGFQGFSSSAWTVDENGKKTYSATTNSITHTLYTMFGNSPTEEEARIRDRALHVNYALFSFAGKNHLEFFLDRFGRLERLTTAEGKFADVTEKTSKETRDITSLLHAEDLASELLTIVLDEQDGEKAREEFYALGEAYALNRLNAKQQNRFEKLVEEHEGKEEKIIQTLIFRRELRRIWRFIRADYTDSVKFSRFSEFEQEDDDFTALDVISGLVESDNTSPEEDVLLFAAVEMQEDKTLKALSRLAANERGITPPAQRAVKIAREIELAEEAYNRHLSAMERCDKWSRDIARRESQLLQAGIKRLKERLQVVIQELYSLQCSTLRKVEREEIAGADFSTMLEQVKNRRKFIRKYEAIAYN